jgi:hypothetical protein
MSNNNNNNIRAQKKNQNARQAMVISGLNTIYRNTSTSHAIKSNKQTEPRIYFLDISLDDINKSYPKIRQIIEKGSCVNGNGCPRYHVKTKIDHLLITDADIYEIAGSPLRRKDRDHEQHLYTRVPVDGIVSIKELKFTVSYDDCQSKDYSIPVLIDESYYELMNTARDIASSTTTSAAIHIPTNHTYITHVKKTIRFHPTSPNAFVFVFSRRENRDDEQANIIDFYMTTEDGVIPQNDKLNHTFKEDLISFLLQFKLCP